MFDIQTLNADGLAKYIESEEFRISPALAISHHRAVSQLNNPRLRPDDVVMLLARVEGSLAGYLGVLPDTIFSEEGKPVHIGWMSCLWVHPAQRGKNIARKLMDQCIESWNHHIVLTEFTAAAGAMYQKSGFFSDLATLEGRRWYIRSDLERLLKPRKAIFKKMSPVLRATDAVLNLVLDAVRPLKKVEGPFSFGFTDHVPEEAKEWISDSDGLFSRGPLELDWILGFPWVLPRETRPGETTRYHFTSVDTGFDCKGMLAKDAQGQASGFLVFTFRNGHLRIPYWYQAKEHAIKYSILYLIAHLKVRTLTLYSTPLIDQLKSVGIFMAPDRRITRRYLIAKKLLEHTGKPDSRLIQDGDGDCAFT